MVDLVVINLRSSNKTQADIFFLWLSLARFFPHIHGDDDTGVDEYVRVSSLYFLVVLLCLAIISSFLYT